MIDQLYKKKIIRDFLSLFSDNKWNQLISITLEYGILMLKSNYNLASLSLDDITNYVDDIKENQNKKEIKNVINQRVNTKSDIRTPSNNTSITDDKAIKPKSKWRKGDDVVFKKKTRSTSNLKESSTVNHNVDMDISLKSEIYPKWWGEKKIKMSSIKRKFKEKLDISIDSRKNNRNLKKSTSESQNEIFQQEESLSQYQRKNHFEKEKSESIHTKPIVSVDKRFNKRKPNQANTSNINAYQNLSRNNKEDTNVIMSFDMNSKNRFPYARKVNKITNESSNYNSNNNSKNRGMSEQSLDKTPDSKRRQIRIRKTDSLDSQIEVQPKRAESRIKDHLQKDKKLFSLLKKSNYQNNEEANSKVLHNERNLNERSNNIKDKENQKSNFLIEFDKNFEVQNIKEKSQERQPQVFAMTSGNKKFQMTINKSREEEYKNYDSNRRNNNINVSNNVSYINDNNEPINNSFYNNISYDKSNVSILNREKKLEANVSNNNFAPLNDSLSFINKLQNISAEINLKNNNTTAVSNPKNPLKPTYINTPSFNKDPENYRPYEHKNMNSLNNRSEYNDSDVLSSYAPSERTKNLYLKGFNKDAFSDRNSYNNLSISESVVDNYSKMYARNKQIDNSSGDDDYMNENQINLNQN